MKCKILHETTGRLRVHLCCGRMTLSQADVLEYYLRAQDGVQEVRVYDRTQDAVVLYDAERGSILRALAVFSFAKAEAMELVPEHTSRALNREFEDKLAVAVMRRCISKLFLPVPITTALAVLRSVKYIREGLSALWHGRLSVAVLDATAVTVSMVRGDFATAGSVMFMLHLGEIPLVRGAQGVWSVWLPGEQHGRYYTFAVTVNGITRETGDPYARAAGVNGA